MNLSYIRKLVDGKVSYDLAEPFKRAFIDCPVCGGTMLVDRKTWIAECLQCDHIEGDVPSMVTNRLNISRGEACISFGIFEQTQKYSPADEKFSFAKIKSYADQVPCTMKAIQEMQHGLLRSPFLLEALDKLHHVKVEAVQNDLVGMYVCNDVGFFIFPKIHMFSYLDSIAIVSMQKPGRTFYKKGGCNNHKR